MKKHLIAVLALFLAAIMMLAACGKPAEPTTAETKAEEKTAAAETEEAAETEAAAETKAEAEETKEETDAPKEDAAKDFEGAELVVATWGWAEAGLRKLIADFETKYNCKIIVDPTSGNSDRLNKLMAEKADPTADVAMLTKSFAETGIKEDLFEKIDENVVTSLDELYGFAQNESGYGPCYSVVRYGIMYDAAALKEKNLEVPSSYVSLFDDKYAGRVALPDMASTAGPYMLIAMAEALGGSMEDVSPAMTLMQEKKDNIPIWYSASSDVVTAFTTGEIDIAVFMDINMPGLIDAGLDMAWVDAEEGSFAAPATINVVKNAKNPELAQLFVEYLICEKTQSKMAESMNEAPVNKNATMPDELKRYLVFGEDAMGALKEFDEAYIVENKKDWIDTFQRTVNIN